MSGAQEERGVTYKLQLPEPAKPALIGIKRYGGYYCTKCEVTLLKEGEEAARLANKQHVDACPLCGAKIDDNDSTIRECQCFDWRMAPHRLHSKKLSPLTVIDTFGEKFSVDRFLQKKVDECCPIQLYDKIDADNGK